MLLVALGVLVSAGVIIALVRSAEDDGPAGSGDATSYDRVFAGLCSSAAAADAGELTRAHDVFLDRAHTDLHGLADDLAAGPDRPLAARLLEAKNRVEATLPAGAPNAAADLRRLVASAAEGIAAMHDHPSPTCPEDPAP